ncbi:Acb2/Tad1 domain-containing protein [Rubneribacter sp.]
MDKNTIDNNFKYHVPLPDQPARYELLRSMARKLAYAIQDECPDSREKSLAFTKLEECVMWANASIARNEDGGL